MRLDYAIRRYGVKEMESISFVGIIRDPVHRLISAYRDKIGRGSLLDSREYFWRLYGRKIIAKYRNITAPQTEKLAIRQHLIPTFSEFVQFVIDSYPGKRICYITIGAPYQLFWLSTFLYDLYRPISER